jgi:hypothetical protein
VADTPEKRPANGSGKKETRKKRLGKKATTWSGSLIGAAIIAFITSYFTALGTHAASANPGQPTGNPIQITVGNVTGADGDPSSVLPMPVRLSKKMLNYLNSMDGNPVNPAYQHWFSDRNVAFARAVDIQLVVQGNRHHLVRIIDITPVERCSAPLHGTLFFSPPQGADPSAKLYFDLDNPQLPASYSRPAPPKQSSDYFGQYSISLAYGDQFTFQIIASTQRQYCQFGLNLTVVDDGKVTVQSANDHGRPFRVTSYLAGKRGSSGINFPGYRDLYLSGAAAPPSEYGSPNAFGRYPWGKGNPRTFRW